MKTRKHFNPRVAGSKLLKCIIAIAIVALALAVIGCGEDEPTPEPGDTPKLQPDTPRALSFGTNCKVTIKSNDLFTTAEWNTLCDKVVAAIENGYKIGTQGNFTEVFASAWGAIVVLGSNFTYNWEVIKGDSKKAYIKTASIGTVNYEMIVMRMKNDISGKDPA